jgi:hypothetical protein
MKDTNRLIISGFCILLTLALLTGCSFFDSKKTGTVTGIDSKRTPVDPIEGTALGDPKYLNIEIPESSSDAVSSPTSIFYDPNNKPENLADNFLPEWVEKPAATAQSPGTEQVAAESKTPANTGKKASDTQKSPVKTDNIDAKLAAAKVRLYKAYDEYTKLSTTGGEGNVEEALREYQEAHKEVKRLQAEAKK